MLRSVTKHPVLAAVYHLAPLRNVPDYNYTQGPQDYRASIVLRIYRTTVDSDHVLRSRLKLRQQVDPLFIYVAWPLYSKVLKRIPR